MATILSIHAHPDDAEILAGGTLALLADLGHHITIATFTPGDCGSKQLGPEEIANVRRREAANAAALIGARYVCLEMRDLAIFDDDVSRRRVTETLRQTRPDLVLTAAPSDYHCDHEAASALVRDACFAAPAPNYSTRAEKPAPPIDRIPHLYFMDPVEGRERDGRPAQPDFVVDIAATFNRKRAMLAEHASQRIWLREHHGTDDYLDAMEHWTRERGALVGVPFGEGFRLYQGHAYPQTRLLEELLGPSALKFGLTSA
jgi:LmbE family N-acetylglucosaminyl deacetylase